MKQYLKQLNYCVQNFNSENYVIFKNRYFNCHILNNFYFLLCAIEEGIVVEIFFDYQSFDGFITYFYVQ